MPDPLGTWAGRGSALFFFQRPAARLPRLKRRGSCVSCLVSCLGACLAALPAAGAEPARPPITAVSHLAVYASDAAKAEAFYVHDLGAVKLPDPENPPVCATIFRPPSSWRCCRCRPAPASAGWTMPPSTVANAEGHAPLSGVQGHRGAGRGHARAATAASGSRSRIRKASTVEFVQPPARRPTVANGGLSTHIIHVGFIIHDRQLEDTFYRDMLGFRPYWSGGMKDDVTPAGCRSRCRTAPTGWNI